MTALPRVEREFVIRGELGLHARPAGRFASQAGQFVCEITLSRGGAGDEWVNGQSVLSILSLAANSGDPPCPASRRGRCAGSGRNARGSARRGHVRRDDHLMPPQGFSTLPPR